MSLIKKSVFSFVLAVSAVHASTEPNTDVFAQSGAERIVVTNRIVCDRMCSHCDLSDVVFTDDSTRFAYALHSGRTNPTKVVVRDALTTEVLYEFTWETDDPVEFLSWSPNCDRLLCLATKSVSIVNVQKKDVKSVPCGVRLSHYARRIKWATETQLYIFHEHQRVTLLDLNTLKTTDPLSAGKDGHAEIENPLKTLKQNGRKPALKGDEKADRFARLERECFEPKGTHAIACLFLVHSGSGTTVYVNNRDGSFSKYLGAYGYGGHYYPAPDLKTIVMVENYNTSSGICPDGYKLDSGLVVSQMGLRPTPDFVFNVAFAPANDLQPKEKEKFEICQQAKCSFRATVYGPFTNTLNGRVVGPNMDCRKGRVLFTTFGGAMSTVRVIQESKPIAAGDIISDLVSDDLPHQMNSGFYVREKMWFALERLSPSENKRSSSE